MFIFRKPDKSEVEDTLEPCPYCLFQLPKMRLDCPQCKNHIPFCILTVRTLCVSDQLMYQLVTTHATPVGSTHGEE